MKKRTARSKHVATRRKRGTKTTRAKKYINKGGLGAGMAYVILGLLVIAAGGSLLIGNIIPISSKSPSGGQPVIILPPNTKPANNNLQLFTFPGATYTPTPSPTTPPQPQISAGPSGGPQLPGPTGGNTVPITLPQPPSRPNTGIAL